LQWRASTLDIREQFHLDITITKQLCIETGISHPASNGVPQFMSTDFVVNSKEKGEALFVIQVKDSSMLRDSRTIEKLEIERRFWQKKKTSWYLVTEKEIPAVVV